VDLSVLDSQPGEHLGHLGISQICGCDHRCGRGLLLCYVNNGQPGDVCPGESGYNIRVVEPRQLYRHCGAFITAGPAGFGVGSQRNHILEVPYLTVVVQSHLRGKLGFEIGHKRGNVATKELDRRAVPPVLRGGRLREPLYHNMGESGNSVTGCTLTTYPVGARLKCWGVVITLDTPAAASTVFTLPISIPLSLPGRTLEAGQTPATEAGHPESVDKEPLATTGALKQVGVGGWGWNGSRFD
jgi:hypothetical protein